MKKTYLKKLLFSALIIAGLSITSCGKQSGQEAGTENASEANGDVSGSKERMDNEDSGRAAGESADGIQTSTDTTHTGNQN